MRSEARRKTLSGARQSGKSHAIAADMVEVGFEGRTTSMYIAPTSKAARNAVWQKLHTLNDDYKLGIELKEGAFVAKFPNGSLVGFEGAHDTARVKRLRGATLTGKLWVDEAAFFPEPIIRELMGPTASAMFLASPNGQRIVVASSPGMQRRGYFFDLVHGQREKWEPHALYVQDNPVIVDPEAALYDLREANAWDITTPAYMREGLGLWVDDATHSVYELTELNLIDELPPGPFTSIMLIDFGKTDQSSIGIAGWRDYDPTLYVQYVEGWSDIDIEDLCQRALPLLERYDPIGVYGDSGGGGSQHMEYMRKRHQIPIRPVAKKQNYKKPAIDALNADMRRGHYKVLRSSPLVEQMQALQWDPVQLAKGKFEEHASMPNDLCDTAGVYAHVQARHYRAESAPPPTPEVGTQDYWKKYRDEGLRHAATLASQHHARIAIAEEERALLTGGETD